METGNPRDWHNEPWAQRANNVALMDGMALLDSTSVLLQEFPELLSDGLSVELTLFREAVQQSHPELNNYHGKYAPRQGKYPPGTEIRPQELFDTQIWGMDRPVTPGRDSRTAPRETQRLPGTDGTGGAAAFFVSAIPGASSRGTDISGDSCKEVVNHESQDDRLPNRTM